MVVKPPEPAPEQPPPRAVAADVAAAPKLVASSAPPPRQVVIAAPVLPVVPRLGEGTSVKPGPCPTARPAQPGVRAKPKYLLHPEPPYPATARRRRQEGLVLLTVKVTAQGHAARVELKESSGFPALDEAALRAVRDWEFEPARLGTVAVESEIEVPVRFRLTN